MTRQPILLAKTTRPSLAGVIPRERLFGLLDEARAGSIVWITGPPGCGKTTLAANYLERRRLLSLWYQLDEGDDDVASFFYCLECAVAGAARRKLPRLPRLAPEYLAGLPTFTRRYFQALYQRLGKSFAIVFDGYHDVPAQSSLHEVMRIAAGEVPPGGALVLVSRSDPPASMARLRANRAMSVIGWPQLRLTREESDALVGQRRRGTPTERLTDIYDKTQGWAAGLVLMLQQSSPYESLAGAQDLSTPQLVFEYLAGEIFQKTDTLARELMLSTAYLPHMTEPMAVALTGNPGGGSILAELHRNNYFTSLKQAQPRPIYEYHPLLREFLLARANETFDPVRRARLRRQSADLLLAEDRLAEAVGVLRDSQDWQGIVPIIEAHAATLLDRGLGETLSQWVNALPKEVQQRNPWTLYWLGVSRISVSPREARRLHEQAYELFCAQTVPDLKGQLLACTGAMDAILYELDDYSLLDRWIARTDALVSRNPELYSGALEARAASSIVASMILRQQAHPDIERWAERAYAASKAQSNPNLRLHVETRVTLGIMWAGHFPKALSMIQGMRSLVAEHEVSPFQLCMLKLTEAGYYMLSGESEACLRVVTEGLDIERATGAHVMTRQFLANGAGGALMAGDVGNAARLLAEAEALPGAPPRFDACMHHLCATWLALLQHDTMKAYRHQRLALTAAIELGSPHFEALARMAAGQVLFELDEVRNALVQFAHVYDIARPIRNHFLEFTGLMNYAYVGLESGLRPRSGMRALQLALELGKPRQFTSFPLWRPEMLARLCSRALEAGVEREFAESIIRTHALSLDASRTAIADWPWPFRASTFGSFRLLRGGKPVTFSGKVQKRPLDLLKVLIAFGGCEISEERVAEALWPRIDEHSARRSLTITLHRLRKLLGEDRCIVLSEGKLSLDGRWLWVDTWAFDQVVERIESMLRRSRERPDTNTLAKLCERLLGLYAGPFLASEPEAAWMLPRRERDRHRFNRAVSEAARHWLSAEDAGRAMDLEADFAVDLLERALEADPLAESLYRHLILAYAQLDRRAEAAETYERCRRTLKSLLGSDPSAETLAAYEKLRQRR